MVYQSRYRRKADEPRLPMWLTLTLLLVMFGLVGHMDFIDSVRAEYQSKCDGVVDVEGDIVICTKENQKPFIIRELK